MQSSTDISDAELRARAASMIGAPVTDLTRLDGGANNCVYRASAGERRYALKLYPMTAGDTRDRLGTETAALSFLNRHGLRMVPRVVASDDKERVAVYQWIEGEPVGAARDQDVAAALALLDSLHGLRHETSAAELPLASEACLSAGELIRQVERRLARLRDVASDKPVLAALLAKIEPAFAAATTRVEDSYRVRGLAFGEDLAPGKRSLSPSDFGFHNARRIADGTLMFYDFEYFGWDDPVKPVADFVLHPGMTMTDAQRKRFVAGACAVYGADPDYRWRLETLLPLFALRWCLILLNEFLPERWARRVQAGAGDHAAALRRQAAKVETMLRTAKAGLKTFPYGE
jgi:hypothetical protein